MSEQERGGEARDRPTAELMRELTDQTTSLVRQEIELAKVELTEKGKKAGVGAGMFGAAGLFGVVGFAAITACLIWALSEAVVGWLAALIVASSTRLSRACWRSAARSRSSGQLPPSRSGRSTRRRRISNG